MLATRLEQVANDPSLALPPDTAAHQFLLDPAHGGRDALQTVSDRPTRPVPDHRGRATARVSPHRPVLFH